MLSTGYQPLSRMCSDPQHDIAHTVCPPYYVSMHENMLSNRLNQPAVVTVLMFKASTTSHLPLSSADLIPYWETKRHWVGMADTHTHMMKK